MNITVKELAAKKNVKTGVANSILNYFESTGKARKSGKVAKVEKQKGKCANIFELDSDLAAFLGL